MSSTVTVDEKQVLHAIHDYLQKTGRTECAIALEKSSDYLSETINVALPDQLAVLRTLCLSGEWNDTTEYLQTFEEVEDKDGFRQCQCELLEQQYLEVLSCRLDSERAQFEASSKLAVEKQNTPEKVRQNILLSLLSELKKVCATDEHYTALLSLAELPTLEDSPRYSTWAVYPGRLNCFHKVATWLSKTLCLDLDCESLFPLVKSDTTPTSGATTRLVQLLAKGLLYEKCETTCMNRCGEDNNESNLEIFDLCGWMQHQPDSAYQLSPSRFNLVVLPHSVPSAGKTVQKLSKSFSIPNTTSNRKKDTRKNGTGNTCTSQSVPEFKVNLSSNVVRKNEKEIADRHDKKSTSCSIDPNPPTTEKKGSKENDPSGSIRDHGTTSSLQSEGLSQIKESEEQPKATPKKSTGILIREADSTHHKIRVLEEFENNFVATPPLLHQPHLKTGRDSSTPKPSSNKLHLEPSPPTSPVPYASHTHGTPQRLREQKGVRGSPEAYQGESVLSMPRRHFNFSETTEENSIEWPTATLLGQVSDSQVLHKRSHKP